MIIKDLLNMEHGELLQLSGYTLFGWANSVNPNEPCWVEILGDGEVLQIIRANFDLGNQFELLTERQRKCGFCHVRHQYTASYWAIGSTVGKYEF